MYAYKPTETHTQPVDDENENSILPIKITNEKEQLLDKLKDNDLTKNVGTERYMAPEIKLTTL